MEKDEIEILVCHAGTCRNAGARGVLLEIEELVNEKTCKISASGCLGNCNYAPNAMVSFKKEENILREKIFGNLKSIEQSLNVIEYAVGSKPDLSDTEKIEKLKVARNARLIEECKKSYKWNTALKKLIELEAYYYSTGEHNFIPQLNLEQSTTYDSAGYYEESLLELDKVIARNPGHLGLKFFKLGLLFKLKHKSEYENCLISIYAIISRIKELNFRAFEYYLDKCKEEESKLILFENPSTTEERPIESYAWWTVDAIIPISKSTALYHISTKDTSRGHVAFSGRGRTQWQKIWHVTILCMIGANSEGPLNFIERDYTPVSSSMGWEKGECVLLVKIYQNGKGTQWLNNLKKNSKIAISIPKTTLRLPSLNIESGNISYNPASVLLIVAGTGIAPAIQILEYFLNTEKPATLIYSARKGDILWVKRFEWMKEKKQNLKFVICSTPEQEQDEIFNSIADDDTNFPELQIGRITKQLIEQEIQLLEYPKIVISGPASFNSCVSLYCAEFNIPKDKISILDA